MMKMESGTNENGKKITPERVVEMLKKAGKIVTVEQAKKVLELLTILAKLEVKQYLKK